jgi:hypothetical protein
MRCSTTATQVRIGNIAAQDTTRGSSLWRHADLSVGYCCLSVGRCQPLRTLKKMLCLTSCIGCSHVSTMQTTRSQALHSQVSIGERSIISSRNIPFCLRPRSLQTPVLTVSTITSYNNLHVEYVHLSDVYTRLAWTTSNAPSSRATIPGFFVSTI